VVKPAQALNPLNPELNPICYLLALLPHHFLHVRRIRVKRHGDTVHACSTMCGPYSFSIFFFTFKLNTIVKLCVHFCNFDIDVKFIHCIVKW
jgi:hypothetical protein